MNKLLGIARFLFAFIAFTALILVIFSPVEWDVQNRILSLCVLILSFETLDGIDFMKLENKLHRLGSKLDALLPKVVEKKPGLEFRELTREFYPCMCKLNRLHAKLVMNRELESLPQQYRADFKKFFETGECSPEFAAASEKDEVLKNAFQRVFEADNVSLEALGQELHREIALTNALAMVPVEHRVDFKAFVTTGKTSPEFEAVFEKDEQMQKAADIVFDFEEKAFESFVKLLHPSKQDDTKDKK